LPVPAAVSLAVTELLATPTAVAVTFSDTVHDAPGARLEDARLTLLLPAFAVAAPEQVSLRPFGVATTMLPGAAVGRLSVNVIALSVKFWLVLETVIVRLVVWPNRMGVVPNALARVGGLMAVRLSDAVLPLPASLELIVTLLLYTLSTELCTSTLIVHVPAGLPG